MAFRIRTARILFATLTGTVLSVAACGDDDTIAQGPNGGGGDAGVDSGTNPGGSGGNGGSTVDAGGGSTNNDPDAAMDMDAQAPGSVVHFLVPTNGGSVDVTAGGSVVTFTFPASAAGEQITLTPGTATDIGWDPGDFAGVIQMEPDGLQFSPPVIVNSGDEDLMFLDFPSSATQSAPEPLSLAADGSGLELNHFSTLAWVPPSGWCQSSGWNDTADSQLCSGHGANTILREFGCKNYRSCSIFTAQCCVSSSDGGAAQGCTVGSDLLSYQHIRTDTNGGGYPYCALTADGGVPADAGAMSCDEAWAVLDGDASSSGGVQCPISNGSGAECEGVLRMFTTDCESFCASVGLSCIYANQESGGGNPTCNYAIDNYPPPTDTTYCTTVTDAHIWCRCG
jgi:hypothetical protein